MMIMMTQIAKLLTIAIALTFAISFAAIIFDTVSEVDAQIEPRPDRPEVERPDRADRPEIDRCEVDPRC